MRRLWILGLLSGCSQLFGFQEPVVLTTDSLVPDTAPPDAGICTEISSECAGDTVLRTCVITGELPIDTTCSWGCVSAPAPHCGVLDPTGSVVTPADLETDSLLMDQVIANAITIDTNTGSMGAVRPAGQGVVNGIDFQVRGGLGVFRFKNVAFNGAVAITGTNAIAIVADESIAIAAVFDVRGACNNNNPGPGGSAGGSSAGKGSGAGGGERGNNAGTANVSGGGGGGYGAIGSKGGDGGVSGGVGGSAFGDPEITMLVGGSGGGGGGRGGDGGQGGGGGGAIFIASNTSIRIALTGGINAGGCGGRGGQGSFGGGGGGGAGGAILLEAPSVTLDGQLGVNGGGGGGAAGGSQGEDAPIDEAADGGTSAIDGSGGKGGAGTSPSGGAGENAPHAGGGGGAVGRIRINTRANVEVVGNGSTSPPLGSGGSSATTGVATVN